MKKCLFPLQFVFLAILMFIFGARSEAQVTLAGWTFPTAVTPATTTYSAECGVFQSTAMIYLDGTNGSSNWVGGGPIMFYTGTAPALENAACEVTTATQALSLVNQNSLYNDNCIVFKLTTTGYSDLMLKYSTRGTSTGFANQTWAHSTDGITFTDDTTFTGRTGTSFTALTVDFSDIDEIDDQGFVYIRLTVSGATSTGNNRFDNINFTGVSLSATASVDQPRFSVATGKYCSSQNVAITCDTVGAEIYYTLDGTTPDSLTGTLYTNPIEISSTTTLTAIAYKEGLDASILRTATYTLPTVVADISTFKAGADNSYYKIMGDVTVVFQSGNNLYVQDATAGLLIYSSGLNSYNNGDVISGGICGTVKLYGGIKEMTNPEFENPTAVAGTPILPISVTISDLLDNWDTYDSKLIQLEGVHFAAGTFGTSINLYQGTDSMACYNLYSTLGGISAPVNEANVIGMAVYNNILCQIAPRYPSDIIETVPSVTINAPDDYAIFEENDFVNIDITTQFFNYEDGRMIKFELRGGLDTVFYCQDDVTLSVIENANLTLPIGDYSFIVSLVDNNLMDLTPPAIDSVSFSVHQIYIAIEATPDPVTFTASGEMQNITVSAFNLTEAIIVSCSNPDFSLSTNTLPANTTNGVVSITYNGTTGTTATLTLTSGTVITTITLLVEIPIDTVFYSTGFEATDGFTAGTVYNNQTVAYTGDELNMEYQWGTYFGTPSTTSPVYGAQSMQMRWYTSTPDNIGYTFTNFDVPNATKVEFSAKNTNDLNVSVSYSIDGGATYVGDSIFMLQSTTGRYTYHICDSGQYDYVRVKFAISLPTTLPTATSRLYIDSVLIYQVPGLGPTSVATPEFSVPEGVYFDMMQVEITCRVPHAQIYYTTDGSDPDSLSGILYENPINIVQTTTLKAIAYKQGLDVSNIAIATYTYPTEVADLATFKAVNETLGTNTTPYKITGDVTFVYRSGRYIYIQDATAGLLVYDNQTSMITNNYVEGDVISGGIFGTYTVYNGLIEMIPLQDWAASTTNTGDVAPVVVTASDLMNNFAAYESQLVKIIRVTYTDGGTFTTASATTIDFVQDGNVLGARNQFKTLDTTIVAASMGDIIGFASIYTVGGVSTIQLFPRSNEDLLEASLPMPIFTPAGGTYNTAQSVTLSVDLEDASIFYTIDGTTPTDASTLYVAPIEVATDMTIKAITYLDGQSSEVAVEDYIIEVGINESENDLVRIYPNPMSDLLAIQADNNIGSRVEIINAYGQVVYRNDSPVYPLSISFSDNASGIYFVRILNSDNSVIVKKITKL